MLGDISSALNFLVLSQCQEEAFAMAQVIVLHFTGMSYIFYLSSLKSVWINMLRL